MHARLVPARTGFRLPPQGLLFLAVPDGAISEMASRVARMNPPAALAVVHLSGALGLDALIALEGNPRGSFHPLQSFPTPREPEAFRGITVAVDASTTALRRRLARLARELGAKPKHVTGRERVLYHAAAVYASNFVDVVLYEAVRMLGTIGWTEAEATRALMPLVDGAVANVRKRGVVGALTGPIRRGDAETVARHLEALRNLDAPIRPGRSAAGPPSPASGEGKAGPPSPASREGKAGPPSPASGEGKAADLPGKRGGEALPSSEGLYRMLALVALGIATEAGLDPAAARRTRRALTRDVAATRRRGRR